MFQSQSKTYTTPRTRPKAASLPSGVGIDLSGISLSRLIISLLDLVFRCTTFFPYSKLSSSFALRLALAMTDGGTFAISATYMKNIIKEGKSQRMQMH